MKERARRGKKGERERERALEMRDDIEKEGQIKDKRNDWRGGLYKQNEKD